MNDAPDAWLADSLADPAAPDAAFAAAVAAKVQAARRARLVRRLTAVIGVTLLTGALASVGLVLADTATGLTASGAGSIVAWLPYATVAILAAVLFRDILDRLAR